MCDNFVEFMWKIWLVESTNPDLPYLLLLEYTVDVDSMDTLQKIKYKNIVNAIYQPRMNAIYWISDVLSCRNGYRKCYQQHNGSICVQSEYSRVNFHMIHL